jgi:hypothetical protein
MLPPHKPHAFRSHTRTLRITRYPKENLSVIITFLVYLAFCWRGAPISRSATNRSDHLIGDRQLNKWVMSLSAQAGLIIRQ